MKLITPGEVTNRVDQLMNDKSECARLWPWPLKLLSLVPMIYHKASPGTTVRDGPLQNLMASCFMENKAKSLNMSKWLLILESKAGLVSRRHYLPSMEYDLRGSKTNFCLKVYSLSHNTLILNHTTRDRLSLESNWGRETVRVPHYCT